MQRFLTKLFAIGVILMTITVSTAHADFIEPLGDVPLPPRFEIIEDSLFSFEQENGRVIEITIAGIIPIENTRYFYNQSLINLGWSKIAQDKYIRDQEELNLNYNRRDDNTTIIRINLSPRP